MDSSTAEQMWLLTSRMAADAKEQGMGVQLIFALLRNAKSILNEARLDEYAHLELITRAEGMVNEVQRKVFVAAVPLGKNFEEKWVERIGEVSFSWAGYYPGMPRKGSWVRLALGDTLSKEMVKDIATTRTALSIRPMRGVMRC